ncbi:stage II sporulation protein M [Paenibacillus dokdonensis]|uniref:Stage II sporulation protein M n=1 Tax=Paenibacillus dokdonensis TaxID=2567944 RepID=A0ABU6GW46_9BACL|nr:stage II sporulation protein M [Paenibacillus dokdonensis]MEC0243975.1 stage II sporulation protein M [Paenibacillus dokdonensis]
MLRLTTFLKDLGAIRKTLVFVTILFILGIVAGWYSTGSLSEIINQQMGGIRDISEALSKSTSPKWSFFVFIFFNNSIKAVVMIFLGLFVGVLPILFLLINGMVVGYLVHSSMEQGNSLFDLVVKGLLPHGIIEIPAIIIACAFGLQMGLLVLSSLGGSGKGELKRRWREMFRRTLTASVWIVILLFVAAIIESTVTYTLMKG